MFGDSGARAVDVSWDSEAGSRAGLAGGQGPRGKGRPAGNQNQLRGRGRGNAGPQTAGCQAAPDAYS